MRTITLCILALALAACGGGTGGRKAAETAPAKPTTFVFPEIPDLMTEPDQRLAYLVRHFWDEFDFADSTSLTNPDVGEQGFANFIALLPQDLPGDARAALDSLVKRAAPHPAALTFLLTNAEKYLYDPNSPYVNEELLAVGMNYEKPISEEMTAKIDTTHAAYGAEIIKQLASAKPEEIDEAKEELQKIYDQMKDICKSYREEKEKQIEEAYQDYLKKKAEAEQAESERQAARGEDKSSRLDLSQFVSEE